MPEFMIQIDGVGHVVNQQEVLRNFKRLDPGYHNVKIVKGKKRTNAQNAFYHGVVLDAVRHGLIDIGYMIKDNDTVHEMMKTMFLAGKIVNEINGDKIPIYGSTAKLTTVEFTVFLEELTIWAAEYLSITIPAPSMSVDIPY